MKDEDPKEPAEGEGDPPPIEPPDRPKHPPGDL